MTAALGLGLAALGRPGYINLGHGADFAGGRSVADLRRRTREMLDDAWSLGIRHVDAARSYGRAEAFLGEWLHDRPAEAAQMTVSSKWGYTYTANWTVDADVHEVKDHSLATFARQRVETQAALGPHLDVYQVHSATRDSGFDSPEVLEALAEFAESGVRVGLSLTGPGQADTLRHALDLAVGGVNPFTSVQATFNLLEPSAGPALAEAHDAGWLVLAKETVANGRLTARGDAASHVVSVLGGAVPGGAALGDEVLGDAVLGDAAPADSLAISWVRAQPYIDVALSGASTPAQLRSNSVLFEAVDPEASLAEDPKAYWTRRAALPWS